VIDDVTIIRQGEIVFSGAKPANLEQTYRQFYNI
jgi:ABC-type multidrug transport system ATPase subunit